jgi:hypothetical protein
MLMDVTEIVSSCLLLLLLLGEEDEDEYNWSVVVVVAAAAGGGTRRLQHELHRTFGGTGRVLLFAAVGFETRWIILFLTLLLFLLFLGVLLVIWLPTHLWSLPTATTTPVLDKSELRLDWLISLVVRDMDGPEA